MNEILTIAYELRKNTTNIDLQHYIAQYIVGYPYDKNFKESIPVAFSLSKFHQCLKYIEEENFDISGWGLLEIPHQDVFCFCNKKENQNFDLVYNWFANYEIKPSYISNSNNELAQSIEEAIRLYENQRKVGENEWTKL